MPQMANSLSTRLDPDALTSLPRDRVAALTQAILNPISSHKGHELMAATAVLFAVMVERYGGRPEGLYEYGRRVLGSDEPFHKKGNDQLEALRDFAAMRVNNNPTI